MRLKMTDNLAQVEADIDFPGTVRMRIRGIGPEISEGEMVRPMIATIFEKVDADGYRSYKIEYV